MEGIPNKKLIPRAGTENDRFPVFDRVPFVDVSQEDDIEDELTPAEIEEFERAERELAKQAEKLPGELTEEERRDLQGALKTLAQSNAAKYVRSGIAAIAIGGAFGSDKSETVSIEHNLDHQNELSLDNQYATDFVTEGFKKEFGERVRNPEEYMSEFEKRVKKFYDQLNPEDVSLAADNAKAVQFDETKISFRSEEKAGRPPLPAELQDALRELVQGWLSQESLLIKDARSKNGAYGYGQYMEATWKEYTGQDKVSDEFAEHMRVFGELNSDNYHYILHFSEDTETDDNAIEILKSRFSSAYEFNTVFMPDLLKLAYNAGGPLVGKSLLKFTKAIPTEELKTGKELITQFLDWAAEHVPELNHPEKQEYIWKTAAFSERLKDLNNLERDEAQLARSDEFDGQTKRG